LKIKDFDRIQREHIEDLKEKIKSVDSNIQDIVIDPFLWNCTIYLNGRCLFFGKYMDIDKTIKEYVRQYSYFQEQGEKINDFVEKVHNKIQELVEE